MISSPSLQMSSLHLPFKPGSYWLIISKDPSLLLLLRTLFPWTLPLLQFLITPWLPSLILILWMSSLLLPFLLCHQVVHHCTQPLFGPLLLIHHPWSHPSSSSGPFKMFLPLFWPQSHISIMIGQDDLLLLPWFLSFSFGHLPPVFHLLCIQDFSRAHRVFPWSFLFWF